jgi:hypothetical protein
MFEIHEHTSLGWRLAAEGWPDLHVRERTDAERVKELLNTGVTADEQLQRMRGDLTALDVTSRELLDEARRQVKELQALLASEQEEIERLKALKAPEVVLGFSNPTEPEKVG